MNSAYSCVYYLVIHDTNALAKGFFTEKIILHFPQWLNQNVYWVKKPYIYYYTVYVALSHYIWIQIHAHFNFKIFFIICILSGMKEGKFYCNFMYG